MTAARVVFGLLLMCSVTLSRAEPDDAELRGPAQGASRYPTLGDGVVMTVIRDGDLLVGQWPDQGSALLHAESERVFNLSDVEAQLVFDEPVDGHSPGVILQQNGQSFRAQRVR